MLAIAIEDRKEPKSLLGHDATDSVRQEVFNPVSLVGSCQRPKRGSGPKAPKTPRSKRFGTLVEKLSGGQSTYRPLFSCKNVSHDFDHFLLKKRSRAHLLQTHFFLSLDIFYSFTAPTAKHGKC